MRLFKDGVSAVVVMSFILFFSGLSFVYGANQIKGGISGISAPDVVGATVSLVGKPSISTTSTLEGGKSTFYLTLPTNSVFSLKVAKSGHITSYSTPTILKSDIEWMHMLLPETSVWNGLASSSGITIQSGKGQLTVTPLNNTTDPGVVLQGAMTAIVKDLSGTSLVSTGNTRYINQDSFGTITITQAPTSNTLDFVVFNLTPGTVIVSAGMSGRTLNSRQTIIYPDSITSCSSLYDGIIESTLGDFTGYLEDEYAHRVPSVNINLLGVKSTTSDDSGNFTLSNIPYNNIPNSTTSTYLKETKTGYKDIYSLEFLEVGHRVGEIGTFSTSFFATQASQAGVTIDSTKGCIGTGIRDSADQPVSGAVAKIYNPDGTENGAHVYYLNSSGNIDPLLTSTSSQGVFVAFNIDPATPVIVTAQKGALEFPYTLDRTFANGFTNTSISSATDAGYAISGNVSLSGGPSSATDVLLTLSGGGPTETTYPDSYGNYGFAGLTADYTLTPSLSNYTFSPVSRTYSSYSGRQSGQNFIGTYTLPANPASISGTISYSGTKTGTIYIGLEKGLGEKHAYITTIESPGTYSISNIAPGTYYVGAIRDTNGDGIYDSASDPIGMYVSNPITLSNNQNATGINITLTDPSGGDINGDGAINITDVILCLRQAIGLDTPSLLTSDINGDGAVNITDVILILRKAIGLDARMGSAVIK